MRSRWCTAHSGSNRRSVFERRARRWFARRRYCRSDGSVWNRFFDGPAECALQLPRRHAANCRNAASLMSGTSTIATLRRVAANIAKLPSLLTRR